MAFEKGKPRPPGAGRRAGTPNKTTAAMREVYLEAFEKLGGVSWLIEKAAEDPATFLRGLQRMIPNEVAAKLETEVNLVIERRGKGDDDGVAEG